MKIKSKFKKIIYGILTFLLIIYISTCLILFTFINTGKKTINKDNLYKVLDKVDISEIIKTSGLEEFDKLKDEILNIGISEESYNNLLNSEDLKEYSENIITSITDKVLGISDEYIKIDSADISNILNNNLEELNENSNIVTKEQRKIITERIQDKLPNIVEKVNELIDAISNKIENSEIVVKYKNYIYQSLNIFDIIYSTMVNILIIIVTLSFIALLIIIKGSVYKSLKWLSISFLVPGILITILKMAINRILISDNIFINTLIDILNLEFKKYSIIYITIMTILILLNILIYSINNRKKGKISYEKK